MNLQKLGYVLDGLVRRVSQSRLCPSCKSDICEPVDRKGFHELMRCAECRLLFRYPYETPEEMSDFYERKYSQPGLTTELPDPTGLENLLATNFRGSQKDFSHLIGLLNTLQLPKGSKVLDFGANWGYAVWQLTQVGFSAIGYEPSRARASFSKKLGAEVFWEWCQIEDRAPFDLVFSSHVLEHTPDPAWALERKISVLAPGGLLVALMPNGSESFRRSDPNAFHRLWGQVHPVMLNDEFIRQKLSGGLALGALIPEDLEQLKKWNRATTWVGSINRSELLIIWSKPKAR